MLIVSKARQLIRNTCDAAADRWGSGYRYDTLPPESIRAAAALPFVREALVDFSVEEYERNPYYQLVIENLANHTVGPAPNIIGTSKKVDDSDNDMVEDSYNEWVSGNAIGESYRNIRREAAKTGIAIGVPFTNKMSLSPVALSYKVYGADCMKNPVDSRPEDRIINGIEYDKDWEIEAFHIKDDEHITQGMYFDGVKTKEYKVHEVIHWARNKHKGMVWPLPECYSAFSFYPYVRRYMQAVIEGEEFLASFPMAVELDPKVYSTYAQQVKNSTPVGAFKYSPGMIPTMQPGMSLSGMPQSQRSGDREKTMQMFAAVCALSVTMPKNLAIGDSSNSNMASAQVDIQPWANKVNIDRFDMEPMYRRSFAAWWSVASLRTMPQLNAIHPRIYPHVYVYPDLFEHPDPNKRAGARATDLASGATTLNRLYSDRGLNFRREVERESQSLGITTEQLIEIIISSRSANALSVVNDDLIKEADNAQDAPARQAS